MSIQALVALALDTSEETAGAQLPMPPVAFGIVCLRIFIALLLVTFAFRNIGQRH